MTRSIFLFRDRRGAGSHYEMVISFVLFILFVTFLLIYIRPTDTTRLSESVISAFHDSFLDEVEVDLTRIFLRANSSEVSGSCFYVELDDDLVGFNPDSSTTYVKDFNGDYRESGLVGNSLSLENGANFDINRTCYRVLVSSVFENSLTGCGLLEDYRVGSVFNEKIISNRSLFEMKEEYELGYDGLKDDLRIPEAFDFAISSDVVVMERNIPDGVEVVAKEYLEEVLYEDGEIRNEVFVLKVW